MSLASHRYLLVPENRPAYEAAEQAAASPRSFARESGGILTISGREGSGRGSLIGTFWGAAALKGSGGGPSHVRRTSAARWCEQFQAADRDETLRAWIDRQATAKTFVVEEIGQFRAARWATAAQHLVEVIDRVVLGGGIVVLTSGRPGQLTEVPPRLADRVAGGLVVEIGRLSKRSRAAMAVRMAEARGFPLTEDHAAAMAGVLGDTAGAIRDDVAVFEKLLVDRGRAVDDSVVTEFVRRRTAAKPSIPVIARVVAREYSARVSDLRAGGRSSAVVLPRQAAMFLARTVAGEPYQAIGDYFGKRNHSTVVHSVKRIEKLMAEGDERVGRIREIRETLLN